MSARTGRTTTSSRCASSTASSSGVSGALSSKTALWSIRGPSTASSSRRRTRRDEENDADKTHAARDLPHRVAGGARVREPGVREDEDEDVLHWTGIDRDP